MVDILDFEDYRDFLRHKFEETKRIRSGFSYSKLAKILDLSVSYMKLVHHKRRHLSLDRVPDVAAVFSLSEYELNCITLMILKQTSNSEEMVHLFHNQLIDIKRNYEKLVG